MSSFLRMVLLFLIGGCQGLIWRSVRARCAGSLPGFLYLVNGVTASRYFQFLIGIDQVRIVNLIGIRGKDKGPHKWIVVYVFIFGDPPEAFPLFNNIVSCELRFVYRACNNGFRLFKRHFFLHGNGFHDLYEGTDEVHAPGEYFPELMVRRSLEFIDENSDRPFFLYVPFNIPHYPEQALRRFETLYEDMEDPARRSYAAIISTTDHYVGQILGKLVELDLRENTIIIFMSDNGHSEETGNRIRVARGPGGQR